MTLMFVDPCIIVQFIKKNPTRCNSVSKFYYSIFIWSSTGFGRHTAHHQEPKTALTASGFPHVGGCWPMRWLSHRIGRQPKTYVKPEAANKVFELLMMGGVSPETCWAIKKHWNKKFYYTVASWWLFLWDWKSIVLDFWSWYKVVHWWQSMR